MEDGEASYIDPTCHKGCQTILPVEAPKTGLGMLGNLKPYIFPNSSTYIKPLETLYKDPAVWETHTITFKDFGFGWWSDRGSCTFSSDTWGYSGDTGGI